MSEWWTYSLSDFLLFSRRTYFRLFELYNADVWPVHLVALGVALALVLAAWRGASILARASCAMLAACWIWIAWAFHLERYASINWAANGFAAAFAVEGLLLFVASALGERAGLGVRVDGPGRRIGLAVLAIALFVLPLLGLLQGRSWRQLEYFGLAPDPTALATIGLLLVLGPRARGAWLLWPVPAAWCAIGAATAWTLAAT